MTGRTLCVWFPDWPLRRPDAPPDRPCQVVGDDRTVVAANAPAATSGVRPGMRRREAEAICPSVVTLRRDPDAEAAAFEPVAQAVESLVPRVEVAAPGLIFVSLGGAVRFYGGEGPLVGRIAEQVTTIAGPGARLGVADGPFAARMAAATAGPQQPVRIIADTPSFLASLDIDVLEAEEMVDTFRWLGIATLGDLAALPRAAVASRFGTDGLRAHRLAVGEDQTVRPRSIPEDPAVEERFEPPLEVLEQASFVARSLAHRLTAALASGGTAPHRVEVEAEATDGTVRARVWRSADPFSEVTLAERVRWQLRAWVESGGIPGGLARLRLVPHDLSDQGRQLLLTEDAASAAEEQRALARAQTLVGPDRLLQSRPQGGRDPGERVQWHRWGEGPRVHQRDLEAPWPGQIPGPAPALVPPEPPSLEIEWDDGFPTRVRLGSRWVTVLNWAGPWRKVGRWWEGEGPADRYQIVTSAGAYLCEVRDGRCFLSGVYD
ncbi:MAG: DNA polymerase Y family protein [Acidimicrobiia bacterium]